MPDEVERFLKVDHDGQRELLVIDGFMYLVCKAHDVFLTASFFSESGLELVAQTVLSSINHCRLLANSRSIILHITDVSAIER